MNTKRRKTFSTWFFPVDDGIRAIVADWIGYLKTELLWGTDDPLFPATRVAVGANRQFEAVGLDRKHWANATPIRAIFKEAFTRADLPTFPPHRVRKTLAQLGERQCRNPEEFKAWSQNLGHEQVMTTFFSYGEVAPRRKSSETWHALRLGPRNWTRHCSVSRASFKRLASYMDNADFSFMGR